MNRYEVLDESDTVIARYQRNKRPEKPDEWSGEWNVHQVESFSGDVDWWNEQ